MAVQLATLTFNKGLVSLVPLLEGLGPEGIGPYDVARLKRATVKTSKHVKKRRKSVRSKKKS